MNFLSRTRDLLLDFLFPKDRKVLALESLPVGELLNTLPSPEQDLPDGVNALFDYDHPVVKELVWELKYKGNPVIARKLGEILHDVIRHELAELALFGQDKRPVLVPVPISDKRRNERGWNQTELLASSIMSCDTAGVFKYLPRQLAKVRHTESQTKTSSRGERLKNLKDSMFVLSAPSVSGRCVILLDDVTTTGATFSEAKRALRAAGAKKIICFAVAH